LAELALPVMATRRVVDRSSAGVPPKSFVILPLRIVLSPFRATSSEAALRGRTRLRKADIDQQKILAREAAIEAAAGWQLGCES
jgi:hypothetical protein